MNRALLFHGSSSVVWDCEFLLQSQSQSLGSKDQDLAFGFMFEVQGSEVGRSVFFGAQN